MKKQIVENFIIDDVELIHQYTGEVESVSFPKKTYDTENDALNRLDDFAHVMCDNDSNPYCEDNEEYRYPYDKEEEKTERDMLYESDKITHTFVYYYTFYANGMPAIMASVRRIIEIQA